MWKLGNYQPTSEIICAGVYEPEEERSFTTSTYAGEWSLWANELGVVVTEESALEYGPVFQAVSLISGDLAKLPLEVRRRTGPNASEAAPNHPWYRFVRDFPNSDVGAFKFWRRLWVQALLWNRAFVEITEDGLRLLESALVSRARLNSGEMVYYYMEQGGVEQSSGFWRPIFPFELLEIEGVTVHKDNRAFLPNKYPSLIDYARGAVELGMAAERFGAGFFKNGGRLGGVLELPLGMPKMARDNVAEGFHEVYERAGAAFKTVILRDGARFHASQATPDKSQMIESRDTQVADVARFYNLPPHKLGLQVQTSYASLEQENKAYFSQTLQPWARAASDECDNKLLTPGEKRLRRFFFKHDASGLMSTELPELMDLATKGVSTGVITPNEARQYLGLNPIEGGNELLRPLNMGSSTESEGDSVESEEDEPTEERNRINGRPILQ